MRDADRTEAKPALMVVRVGALERFAVLERAFGPEGVGIVWDRRVADRRQRQTPPPMGPERRRRERRGPPPLSWSLLDFLVVPGLSLAS